jgi:peptide/nickel transport system substrate-binding protein
MLMITRASRRVAVALLLVLAASAPVAAQEQPRTGGVLKAAMIGEPPSLDLHWTTATITQQITWHFYEGLYTYDKHYNPTPMLAEGHTVSDGGRRYTIRLRRGVKFHTGKEMTSADVVPSLQRWGKMSTSGKAAFKFVEAVEAKGPYEIAIHLKEPMSALMDGLARPGNAAVIYPKEVIDAAGDGQVKEFIGSGTMPRAPSRRMASAASAPPTSTRSSSSRSRTSRSDWPASRPASITSASRSNRTNTIA